jgi:tetratricopeptide (TPR) repeat protein
MAFVFEERNLQNLLRVRPIDLLRSGLILVWLAAGFPVAFLWGQDQEAPLAEFFQIKANSVEGKTRLVLKVRHPVKHTVFSLTNPDRVVINLTPCISKLNQIPGTEIGPIQRVRCSQFDEKTVRLVLDLKQLVTFTISTLEGDPFQLWIDLQEKEKRNETPAQISKKTAPVVRGRVEEKRGPEKAGKKTPPPAVQEKRPVAVVSPDPTPESKRTDPLLDTGRTLLERKQFVQGRETFFHYLNVVPLEDLDLRVVEWIYQSYLLEGNAAQGEKTRRQILRAFSQTHEPAARPALSQLIEFYIESKKGALALPLINQLKTHFREKGSEEENLKSQLRRALIPELEGLFNRAGYTEVLRLYSLHQGDLRDSPDPRLFQLVGNSFKALGLPDPAGKYFQAAWQRGNQDPQGMHLDWAEAFMEKGDPASAVPLLRRVIDHPTVSEDHKQRAYLLLGQAWARQGNQTEALKILEESISRYPSQAACPDRWFLLGTLYAETPGFQSRAREVLLQFAGRSQDPDKTVAAYERIGDLYFREGKFSEAGWAFQQAQPFNRRPAAPFLTQKINQCRWLLEPKGQGLNPASAAGETDAFWKRVYVARAGQQALEKKIGELRLN